MTDWNRKRAEELGTTGQDFDHSLGYRAKEDYDRAKFNRDMLSGNYGVYGSNYSNNSQHQENPTYDHAYYDDGLTTGQRIVKTIGVVLAVIGTPLAIYCLFMLSTANGKLNTIDRNFTVISVLCSLLGFAVLVLHLLSLKPKPTGKPEYVPLPHSPTHRWLSLGLLTICSVVVWYNIATYVPGQGSMALGLTTTGCALLAIIAFAMLVIGFIKQYRFSRYLRK